MSSRTTWLGLLALAGLAAFVWFHEIEGSDAREEAAKSASKVFAGFEAEDVQLLVLQTTDGQRATLERDDGGEGWKLTSPVEFPADALAADGVVSALLGLESEAVYEELEPLASYGLAGEPLLRFQVGETAHEVRLGATAPVGGGVYATDEAGTRVWLLASWRTSAFRKSLHQLRERRLLEIEPESVRSLSVRWPGASVELQRGGVEEGGEWQLVQPLAAPAREATIDDLLSDLGFLRADAFVDEPTPAQQATFEAPALVVEIGTDAETPPLRFEVGGSASEERRLARGPGGVIAEIAAASFEDLPRGVAEFRFRELGRFAPGEAERFTLAFSGGSDLLEVEARRGESGDWEFGADAFAPGGASLLLSELSRLEAVDIAAEAMGPDELAGLGLAPPGVHVTVWGDDASAPLAELSIGSPRADGALPAQRGGSEIVYWLDPGVAAQLPVSAASFREEFRAADETEVESPATTP